MLRRSTGLLLATLLVSAAAARGEAPKELPKEVSCHDVPQTEAADPLRYARSTARYAVPDLELVDAGGERVALTDELERDQPVLLEFIFTTCTTVCPLLAGTFRAAAPRLEDARLVSITIDPENDTPARLAAYAASLGAGPEWRFLTGASADLVAVQRAFDVYRGSKMRHEPVILLRTRAGAPWTRLDGYPTAAQLVAEVDRLRPRSAAP